MNKLKQFIYYHSYGFTLLPFYLAINITNKCNRNCSFCPFHSPFLKESEHNTWFKKQPGNLNYEDFKNFLAKMGIFRKLIKSVAITGKGEPFLNSDIWYILNLLETYKIKSSVTTNADCLKEYDFGLLSLFRYLKTIRISIYNTDRLEYFFNLREYWPVIELYNQTGQEIEGLISGRTVQNEGTEKFCSMPKDFNKINSCKKPFTFLTINTDGSIVPCYSYNEIGNIKDSFLKIWNGKKVREFRRQALKMQTQKSDCKNCTANL